MRLVEMPDDPVQQDEFRQIADFFYWSLLIHYPRGAEQSVPEEMDRWSRMPIDVRSDNEFARTFSLCLRTAEANRWREWAESDYFVRY